jgi:hypothetical protein
MFETKTECLVAKFNLFNWGAVVTLVEPTLSNYLYDSCFNCQTISEPNILLNRFRIAIYYDSSWLAKYVTDEESINAIRRLVANTQLIFQLPSLTTPIFLEVASINYSNVDLPAEMTGM